MDLSVLIPARNEMFLARTIADVISHAKGDTEVIAVLDGTWPQPGDEIADHPQVHLIYHPVAIGQRAATNEAARFATGRYVMKLDAHCSVADGFDVALVEAGDALGHDVTQIPRMYNLHAFDWICTQCGTKPKRGGEPDGYQGPTPSACAECHGASFRRDIVWQPRMNRRSDFMRFDRDLHFQYWSGYESRPEAKGDICDLMSSVGACFFMRRARFFELGGLDEAHGSWGQFGTEIACKSWLSGGRHVVNKRTWFAHMFRTQGGDFGFPYPLPGNDVGKARKHSKHLWEKGNWPGAVRPLSWLIEKFAPVPTWDDVKPRAAESSVVGVPSASVRTDAEPVAPAFIVPSVAGLPTKGLIYYSDGRLDVGDNSLGQLVRDHLNEIRGSRPLVDVSLARLAWHSQTVQRIVLADPRGYLTMFRQILAALEASTADVIFFCEHDVLYHPSHFDFTPPRADRYYYNEHTYKADVQTGQAVFYHTKQTSGLCAYRDLLVQHYRTRVERVAREGFTRAMGFEPGTHAFPRGIDTFKAERWMSVAPNVDLRHDKNLTQTRWRQDQFRNPRACLGWALVDAVPGWGTTKGRMQEFLADVRAGRIQFSDVVVK